MPSSFQLSKKALILVNPSERPLYPPEKPKRDKNKVPIPTEVPPWPGNARFYILTTGSGCSEARYGFSYFVFSFRGPSLGT